MPDQLQCPECGMKLGKGSTFCINCGHRVSDPVSHEEPEATAPEAEPPTPTEIATEEPLLTLEETELEDIVQPSFEVPESSEPETLPPVEDLSWEEGMSKPIDEEPTVEATVVEAQPDPIPVVNDTVPKAVDVEDLTWEGEMEEIKEGMPFKEVEPPRVVSDEIDMSSAMEHLFPEKSDDATREAVAHLFPEGRGTTSSSFIDVVVGTPTRVGITKPMKELDTPACPSCGAALSADEFEYPPYVFEAMGKARMEQGEQLLKSDDHEKAIEAFEMAKLLFERAGNEKAVAESTRKVDDGYDEMAKFHFDQGENHLKADEYEWAVVQFRKARELYMFSTDAKKRAKCSEKVRDAYAGWGKILEDEGDSLAKAGSTREALLKYQEAAAKFREGGATKRLRGLEKKIRKA